MTSGLLDEQVQVGEFTISLCEHGGIWIQRGDGEGGQFDTKSFENAISKFYHDNF